MKFRLKFLQVFVVSIFSFSVAQAQTTFFDNTFIEPGFAGGTDTEFADFYPTTYAYTEWDDPFNTPVPDDVNQPDPDDPNNFSDNLDAVLVQNGTSTAFKTSSGGIYSFAESLRFTIYDDPGYNPGQVILQVGSIGSLPDSESAFLYYRETPGGAISEAIPYTNIGFLTDTGSGFTQGLMAWEWDLSGLNVAEYYITFGATGTSMSFQRAMLDTQAGFDAELANAVFLSTNGGFENVGGVTHSLSGGNAQISYDAGQSVELQATANTDWTFLRWSGATESTSATTTVTMPDGNLSATAIFAPQNYAAWSEDAIRPGQFGGNPLVNGVSGADPNFNGLINVLEYALGGSPENNDDLSMVVPQSDITADGRFVTLSYRRQPVATDLTYRVLVSSDLVTWNYNGDGGGPYYSESISTTYDEDGMQTVTVTDLTDLDTLSPSRIRLMRLEVILN
ncbi:InlB B-repeat-containing protein [Rubellicoccus peritrichatus]|uniref:Bacterial repeat domain-containing protein n=1 Tax=Rubellicoccus peritrichatus TaxID=3080537 RepID=A0AAQ3LAP2_9BACT|nr:hypothetical protein [Puniceicoccus sp. CR14]WOO42644.1 hypothetical protein RZN69_06035 [Puniceicoccus sp. CR14]